MAMRRILTIIGALLLGLIGLIMSVYGGGIIILMVFLAIRDFQRLGSRDISGAVAMLIIPGISLVGGITLVWLAVRLIRKRSRD